VSAGSVGLTARPVEARWMGRVAIRQSAPWFAVLHDRGIRSYAARRDR
jgi:hypothetical protein